MTHGLSPEALRRLREVADPLADETIAAVLGDWAPLPPDATLAQARAAHEAQWQRLAEVTRLFGQWRDNASLAHWRAEGVDASIARPLQAYLQRACALPEWADADQIARAESMFLRDGPLSCLLLFCASLPECYVVPDLAAVLHVAGQLERHTEHRIRATAAMIFPVMMPGGLTTPQGTGIAQVLKVRLIHATIRHLILRGEPQAVLRARDAGGHTGQVPRLADAGDARGLHHALYAHGWDVAAAGLPCHQVELGYTLLTFHYVFLRGLRSLGVDWHEDGEQACLHTWNVVGHLLGIRQELMPQTMSQAAALFHTLQAQGRQHPVSPDPRPALAGALMDTLAAAIPWRVVRPMPVLMTRLLCGPRTARDLGLDGRAVPMFSRLLFTAARGLARAVDGLLRLVWRDASITRLLTRALGTQVVARLLLDQTRPLVLPEHLLAPVGDMVAAWPDDPAAPAWLNRLSRRLVR